jgi:hypothetical protein
VFTHGPSAEAALLFTSCEGFEMTAIRLPNAGGVVDTEMAAFSATR